MGPNLIFFPQLALDRWIAEAKIDLFESELVLRQYGCRYRVVEAVRVLVEVSGASDDNDLVGKVKSVAYLTELGAEILDTSMLLGDNAYEILPGFLATPQSVSASWIHAGVSSLEEPSMTEESFLARALLDRLE